QNAATFLVEEVDGRTDGADGNGYVRAVIRREQQIRTDEAGFIETGDSADIDDVTATVEGRIEVHIGVGRNKDGFEVVGADNVGVYETADGSVSFTSRKKETGHLIAP